MKKIFALVSMAILTILCVQGVSVYQQNNSSTFDQLRVVEDTQISSTETTEQEDISIVAKNLSIPWEVVFLPNGDLLITERPGRLVIPNRDIEIEIPGIRDKGEGGLLGAVLHPEFESNNFLYLYQTTNDNGAVKNRIVRYIFDNDELTFDRIILGNIPGATFHDGGRIAFGPDGYLYATVGDALRADAAQDPNTLEGTIIRITDMGDAAPGNPFGTLVYSYGHRNPQGLAWDTEGRLWSTEHGRSGIRSGFDELNLITPGNNYGWPDSQGDTVLQGTTAPARHSNSSVTWAPGGLAYLDGSLYIPGLRGETLYEAVIVNGEVVSWHEHLVGEYGRLRTVQVGPDNMLYLTTSNQDGRGNPTGDDDRVIRINPNSLSR